MQTPKLWNRLFSRDVLTASFAALLCAPVALAQEADPFQPAPAGDEQLQPPPADGARIEGFREVEGRARPTRTPEEEAARAEEINANYDATLEVYDSILERRDTDPAMVERRLETNREILERYGPKLTESETQLRRAQVAFMNRVLELKRERDAGTIDDAKFRAELTSEKERYDRRRARLVDDVDFYGSESKDAQTRLAELEKEHSSIMRERELRMKDQPVVKDPADEVLDDVFGTLNDLSGFRIRFTMEGVEGYRRYDHQHSFQSGD